MFGIFHAKQSLFDSGDKKGKSFINANQFPTFKSRKSSSSHLAKSFFPPPPPPSPFPLSLLFCFLKASVSRFISFSFPPSHVLPSLSSSALCSSSSHRETMRRSSHQVAPFSLTWKHLGARRRRRRRRLRRFAEAALTSFFLSFISPAFFFFLFLFRTKFDVHTCGVRRGDASKMRSMFYIRYVTCLP